MELADSELASGARLGDAAAFAELIRRHERSMLALAYACTHDAATAADVVQDAFLRCWRRIADLRETERFASWLATTVRNLSSNAMRGPARRMRLAEPHVLDDAARQSNADASERAEADDEAQRLRRAIAQLDEVSAAIVTLRYYEDLPSKQIAELLGTSPAAVDMRLSRARAQLKELLKEPLPLQVRKKSG